MACCFAPKGAEVEQAAAETTAHHRRDPSVTKSGRSMFHLASENIKRFLRQKHLTRSELLQLKNDKLTDRRKEQEQAQSVPYTRKQSGLACIDQLPTDNQNTSIQQPVIQTRLQPLGYTSKQPGASLGLKVSWDGRKTIPASPGQQTIANFQGDRTSFYKLSPALPATKLQAQRTSCTGNSSVLHPASSSRRSTIEDQCNVTADNNTMLLTNQAQFKNLIQPATDLKTAAKAIAEFQIAAATAAAEPVRSGTLTKQFNDPLQQAPTFDTIQKTTSTSPDSQGPREATRRVSTILNSSLQQWLPVGTKDQFELTDMAPVPVVAPQSINQQDILLNVAPLLGPGIGRHRISGPGSATWLSPPSPDLAAVRPHRATYTGSSAISDPWKEDAIGPNAYHLRMSQNGARERQVLPSGKPPTVPLLKTSLSPPPAKQAWGNSSEGDLTGQVHGDGVIVVSAGRLSLKVDGAAPVAGLGLASVKRCSSAGGVLVPA